MTGIGWLALSAALLLSDRLAGSGRHVAVRSRATSRLGPAEVAGGSIAVIAIAFGGLVGLLAAPAIAVSCTLGLRRHLASRRAPPPDQRQLAFCLDLIAAVLASGAPTERALSTVSAAIESGSDGPLLAAIVPLRRVGRLLEFGADPAVAWQEIASVPAYQSVAAAGQRCATSGARLACALTDVANALRRQRYTAALARAQRVGVWTLLPLGLCFLPAFVCLGVVPVVAGVGAQVLSSVAS